MIEIIVNNSLSKQVTEAEKDSFVSLMQSTFGANVPIKVNEVKETFDSAGNKVGQIVTTLEEYPVKAE